MTTPVRSNARTTASATTTAAVRAFGRIPAPGLILAGMVCRQLGAATAKPLFPVVGPFGVATLRLVCSAAILLFVWRAALRIGHRAIPAVIACGAMFAGMNLAFYQALERIPLGPTVAIELLGPLLLAACGSRRPADVGFVVLAGTGVVLLTESGGGLAWAGVAFALVAAGCWVGYILLGARLSSRTSDGSGLALSMGFGALLALPVGTVSAGTGLLDLRVLAMGMGLALLSSVIPYSLEFRALRRIPPKVFGILMSLEPAIAAAAGHIVLSEELHAVQWIAVLCVVVASLGIVRRQK